MKKYLLSFIFIFSSLFAQENIPANSVTTVLTSNDYILAKSQYTLGNYTESYNEFNKLFLKYNDNVEINYYLAMSAVGLKLYDEATSAFERVLIVKPEFHRARLEYARVLFILGYKEDAKKEFLIVAETPIPENVRKNIQNYIDQIDNKSTSTTFFALSFGMMYDDNINSGIDYATYNLPGFGNLQVNGTPPQGSSSYFTSFQMNHIQSLGKQSPLILKHTGLLYYKNQTVNDTYNFKFFSYKPTLYYNDADNKAEYSLQAGIEDIMPGDKSDFMVYSLTPAYRKLINKSNIFELFTQYKQIHYSSVTNTTKNYSNRGLGASWEYKKLKYALSYERDRKDNGTRTDLDKKIVNQSISYSYDIQSTLILNAQYQYKKIDYVDTDVFFASQRKDTSKNIYLGLTKIIDKKDFLTLSYRNIVNNSNQAVYEYDRNSVNLNYTWRFKL